MNHKFLPELEANLEAKLEEFAKLLQSNNRDLDTILDSVIKLIGDISMMINIYVGVFGSHSSLVEFGTLDGILNEIESVLADIQRIGNSCNPKKIALCILKILSLIIYLIYLIGLLRRIMRDMENDRLKQISMKIAKLYAEILENFLNFLRIKEKEEKEKKEKEMLTYMKNKIQEMEKNIANMITEIRGNQDLTMRDQSM